MSNIVKANDNTIEFKLTVPDHFLNKGEEPEKKTSILVFDANSENGGATTLVKSEPRKKSGIQLPPIVQSIFSALDRSQPGDHVERLAFEKNPIGNTQYQSIYRAKLRGLPDILLKRIAIQDDLIAAIDGVRGNQTFAFGSPLENRFKVGFIIEPLKGVFEKLGLEEKVIFQKKIDLAKKRFYECGFEDGLKEHEKLTLPQFLLQETHNAIILGRIAVEIIHNQEGKFHSFRPIDAGTIYQATNQKNAQDDLRKRALQLLKKLNNERIDPKKFHEDEYSWIQVIDGVPVQAFTDDECYVHNFYPLLDIEFDGYPATPIDRMIGAVTTHINIATHNKLYFQYGRASHGMLVIQSDTVNQQVIHQIKQQFNAAINSVNACLDGTTKIWTKENGLISLEEVVGNQNEVYSTIWTGKAWIPGQVYRTQEKVLSVTTLSNGITIKTSPDHRIRCIGEDGEPTWKRQEELQLNDFVLVNKKAVENETFVPEYRGQSVTPEIMEVLGWITGDGCIQHGKINLFYHPTSERWIRDRHFDILQSFGVNVKKKDVFIDEEKNEKIRKKCGFKSLNNLRLFNNIFDTKFTNWMQTFGFTLSSRDPDLGKNIPAQLTLLPSNLKAAFLRGFFSADGNNMDLRNPAITITNHRLRQQTKLLLLSLGIRCNLSEGKKTTPGPGPYYKVNNEPHFLKIKDKGLFFELIGFLQPHKQPRILGGTNKHWGTNNSISQSTIISYLKIVKKQTVGKSILTPRQQMDIDAILRGEDSCSLSRLFNYLKLANISIPIWMEQYHFEKVVKLENTGIIKQMYDVAIYEPTHPCTGSECKNVDHSFMANGILTANSFRMPVFGIDPASTITYQSIDNANRDMEFQYLSDNNARSILSAFQMSPDELPGWSYLSKGTNSQALSESNNQYQLESAKDVGFRPLLKQFEDFLNARIFPLIDKPLSKVCTFKFVGLDAENPDQEIARLQQNSQLHLTYNDILTKVEKKEIPKELGGDVPLNPQYQAILDKYLTVGQIKEIYFGIKGASKNPNFDYMRDPFYFQQQMLLAQRAMIPSNPRVNSPLPPNAEPPETEGYELGGNNQVQPENEQSLPQLSGPEIKEMQVNQSGKPNDSEADEMYSEVHHPFERSADQAMYALKKAEAQLPPSKRKVLQHQKELIQSFVDSWEKDLATATNEVSKIANRFLPKSK